MKNALAVFSLFALLGAGCAGTIQNQDNDGGTTKDDTANVEEVKTDDTAGSPVAVVNAIKVEGQDVGTTVTVELATLDKPGFVIIHEDTNGTPGKIVGMSALLQPGENPGVKVTSKVENDMKYWAMLHADNGDGTFIAADDAPMTNADGNVVMKQYEGYVEGEKRDDESEAEDDSAAKTAPTAVLIQDFAFSQKTLTVKKGDKIIFTNKDGVSHSTTADEGAWDSGLLSTNQSYTLDTSKLAAGTYGYHCTPHPNMKATLVVTE